MARIPATVHPLVERLAAYAWRLLVIAAAAVAVLWLVGRLWVVFLPLVIAALLTRILSVPAGRLRARGWRPALVAAITLLGFLAALAGTFTLLGLAVGGQADDVGPTISTAVDDLERWLVEDAPVDISRGDIERYRTEIRDSIRGAARSSGGELVSGAVVVAEVLVSIVLALIITFFLVKDGERFARWAQRQLPPDRQALAERLGARAWQALGGYLKGAALLGLVEGVIIGTAVGIFGSLGVAVGAFTFLMAFVPIAGAVVAGAVAVLVTLATGGTTAAVIVLAIVIVVQQLDNDLLAPVIYGRSLELHPVTVLLAIAAGGALFGVAGTFLAVPLTAVVLNVLAEYRRAGAGELPAATGG